MMWEIYITITYIVIHMIRVLAEFSPKKLIEIRKAYRLSTFIFVHNLIIGRYTANHIDRSRQK